MSRATEEQVAIAIMQIANAQPQGLATFKRCYAEIPSLLRLSSGDKAISVTRPREPMWHQLVRNIRSHHEAEGNFIERGLLEHVKSVGYRITPAGKTFLQKKRLI